MGRDRLLQRLVVTAVEAAHLAIAPVGSSWSHPDFSMEFIRVSSGTFMMGSSVSETDNSTNEGPQHQVTITKDFYIGKYEVTQGQYEAIMGGPMPYFDNVTDYKPMHPIAAKGVSSSHPVYNSSFYKLQKS